MSTTKPSYLEASAALERVLRDCDILRQYLQEHLKDAARLRQLNITLEQELRSLRGVR